MPEQGRARATCWPQTKFIAESLIIYLHHHTVVFKPQQCPFDHPAPLTDQRLRASIIISFQDDDRSELACQHQPFQLSWALIPVTADEGPRALLLHDAQGHFTSRPGCAKQ